MIILTIFILIFHQKELHFSQEKKKILRVCPQIPPPCSPYLLIRSALKCYMQASMHTHREIFPKFSKIKPKSDCIYHYRIDLEQQTDSARLLLQINRKRVNTI